ncbi:MAG: hypothetical protein ACK41T_12110 [Pseudobdellovibrio sp.]
MKSRKVRTTLTILALIMAAILPSLQSHLEDISSSERGVIIGAAQTQ